MPALNASNIDTGTLNDARLPDAVVRADAGGGITATTFTGNHLGDGSALSNLNASNLTSGKVPNERLSRAVVLRGAAKNAFRGQVLAKSFSGPGSSPPSFAGSGTGKIASGADRVEIVNPAVSARRSVIVTLQSDPASGATVKNVIKRAGKFEVVLTEAVQRATALAYFVMR